MTRSSSDEGCERSTVTVDPDDIDVVRAFATSAVGPLTPESHRRLARWATKQATDRLTGGDASCRQVRVHPLGFMKLPIGHVDEVHKLRVHIWCPRLFTRSSPYTIHDHFFSARSLLITGELDDVGYDVEGAEHGQHRLAAATHNRDDTAKLLVPGEQRVQVCQRRRTRHVEGDMYELDARSFHETILPEDGLTTTLFLQHDAGTSRRASRVVVGADDPLETHHPAIPVSSAVLHELVRLLRQAGAR